MNQRVLMYGTVSGFVIIVTSILSIELEIASAWLGFLVMFIVFSFIFVAVRRHRDEVLDGLIPFGTALWSGLGITLIASLVYVLVWEIYLAQSGYAFIETYTSDVIETAKAQGVSGTELAAKVEEMENMRVNYSQPLFRLPMTFVEIFPVGLLVSLVAAFVLKK